MGKFLREVAKTGYSAWERNIHEIINIQGKLVDDKISEKSFAYQACGFADGNRELFLTEFRGGKTSWNILKKQCTNSGEKLMR